MNLTTRRNMLKTLAGGAGASALAARNTAVPTYLHDYADLYLQDPHAAALRWFRNARSGLFLHYGLYSMLGGEWQG